MDSKGNSLELILPTLLDAVRSASVLAAQDVLFYSSLDKNIQETSSSSYSKLLNIANAIGAQISEFDDDSVICGRNLESEVAWKDVGEIIDLLFEKIDVSFDKLMPALQRNAADSKEPSFIVQEKPQVRFKNPPDNTGLTPFVPKLKSKPFALVPLEIKDNLVGEVGFDQPYKHEIMHQPLPDFVCEKREPIISVDLESTEAEWVDDLAKLQKMIAELKLLQEIAVDLEHHDYRSYHGITCLMQISNRLKDWLIDTLKLRDELNVLNEIFANPNILKVFHGAFMDIIWLQRDLGIYVVSLFDTYHAAKSLGFPKLSLAYLLERFAGFQASKKYQLADWRIRPLTRPMIRYARADTHFLLNIYDQLRNDLVEKDKLKEVLYASRKVAAQKFEYNEFKSDESKSLDSAYTICRHYNVPEKFLSAVTLIMNWRDKVSRQLDESWRYILANLKLIKLATLSFPLTVQQLETYFGDSRTAVKPYLEELSSQLTLALPKDENGANRSTVMGKKPKRTKAKDCNFGLCQLQSIQSGLFSKSRDLLLEVSLLLRGFSKVSSEIRPSKATPRDSAISSLQQLIFNQPGLTRAFIDTPKENNDTTQEDIKRSTSTEAPKVTDDKTKLSTLSGTSQNFVPKNSKSKSTENSAAFDYESARKSFAKQPTVKQKRKLFDPFAGANSAAPAPAKKRKLFFSGKSSSYR